MQKQKLEKKSTLLKRGNKFIEKKGNVETKDSCSRRKAGGTTDPKGNRKKREATETSKETAGITTRFL